MTRSIIALPLSLLFVLAPAVVATAQDARITPVFSRQETYPSPSPDGRYLTYASNASGKLNLYRLDLRTRDIVRLTDGDFEDSAASWSPDGGKIVFQREDERGQRDLWEIRADGSGARNLTNTLDVDEQHPRYAAGGANIFFDSNAAEAPEARRSDRTANFEIYSLSLKDNSTARITDWKGWDMYASPSPDGERIVWRRALPGATSDQQNFEIFVKELGTGRETNISDHLSQDTNPNWSPKGDWIVFVSNREGSSDLYLVRPDGTGLRRIAAGVPRVLGYARPVFATDGSKVFANRAVGGVTDIVVIDVSLDISLE